MDESPRVTLGDLDWVCWIFPKDLLMGSIATTVAQV